MDSLTSMMSCRDLFNVCPPFATSVSVETLDPLSTVLTSCAPPFSLLVSAGNALPDWAVS